MESAKEKAIREAYEALGFEWVDIHHLVELNGHTYRLDLPEGTYDYISDWEWRPKSLQGIENNNGWNLTSEKLPTDLKSYVCLENGKNLTIAFYTKGHEVGFEDWDDYEEYDEVEERDGTLYLKPGWYQECEQQNSAYDTIYFKRNITHWMSFPNLPIY